MKDVVFQVRMDSGLKEQVEALYKRLGTSFAEAVRIFAMQSVIHEGMPFVVTEKKLTAAGIASKYANPDLREQEEGAWEKAAAEKYKNGVNRC